MGCLMGGTRTDGERGDMSCLCTHTHTHLRIGAQPEGRLQRRNHLPHQMRRRQGGRAPAKENGGESARRPNPGRVDMRRPPLAPVTRPR